MTVPEWLNYRSVAQAGEAYLVEAMRRMIAGIVDREIQAMGGEASELSRRVHGRISSTKGETKGA